MSKCPVLTNMLLMLLILATDLTISVDEEFNEAIYNYFASGYSYKYLIKPPPHGFTKNNSEGQCAMAALNSQSDLFSYDVNTSVCKIFLPNSAVAADKLQDDYEKCYYRYSKWIKIFALSAGSGTQIYGSFAKFGKPSDWNLNGCKDDSCTKFFQHPILDIWEKLPIEEVKLVLYKNKTAVVNMLFNGRNTTLHSWFSLKNLKSSPWIDIHNAEVFSIAGKNLHRFYIGNPKHCFADEGWLAMNEGNQRCEWGRTPPFPAFYYSDKDTKLIYQQGKAMADSMAIFLRLTPQHSIP